MGKGRYVAAVGAALAVLGASPAHAAAKPRLLAQSGDRVTVSWSAPRGATSQVRYRRLAARRWRVRRAGHRHRLTLTKLKTVTYLFEVRTCRRHRRCSRWSKPLRVSLRAGTPAPSPAPAPAPTPGGGPAIGTGGCSVFPADNPWNRDVSGLPLDPRSDRYIASIGPGTNLHPDFGSNPDYGIPYVVVPPSQQKVPIHFTDYGDESDPGPYPVPLDARVEAGSDHHVLALQSGDCKLYELFGAQRNGNGWDAASGAVWDLNSNALRHEGWTSADAAGLPIFPGLVRRDETQAGHIDHALRFTVSRTQKAYIHPATHVASSSTDPDLPPMGLRLRMKAGYDISRLHGASLVIAQALKRYGMIVADNGSNWYITGANDTGWNDDDLNQLKSVPGSAFEVVDTGEPIHKG